MKKIIALLIKKGYTQAPWDKCPQGFKESNYPCYQHKDHNVWVQLYPNEKYGHIYTAIYQPGYFATVQQLKRLLPKKGESPKEIIITKN
jgi:hypothetical protein